MKSKTVTKILFFPPYTESQPCRCCFVCRTLIFPHQCGKILIVRKMKTNLKFYRTSVGKSTFRMQNDTDSAFFLEIRLYSSTQFPSSVIHSFQHFSNFLMPFLQDDSSLLSKQASVSAIASSLEPNLWRGKQFEA